MLHNFFCAIGTVGILVKSMDSFSKECFRIASKIHRIRPLDVEDGSEIGGSKVYFPLAPVKHIADLRNRANNQRYSSIHEDRRRKIEDIGRSDSKKSA